MPTLADPPPAQVMDEIVCLNAALDASIPMLRPTNLLIGTWNIRNFGSLTRDWFPRGSYSPKRDLRALLAICEILKRFDVIAIQEVTGDLRALRDTIKYLGSDWAFLMTDISRGHAGGGERLAYLFSSHKLSKHPSRIVRVDFRERAVRLLRQGVLQGRLAFIPDKKGLR